MKSNENRKRHMRRWGALVLALALCASLGAPAMAAAEGENFSDEMKFDDGADISPADGADSVERRGITRTAPISATRIFTT